MIVIIQGILEHNHYDNAADNISIDQENVKHHIL